MGLKKSDKNLEFKIDIENIYEAYNIFADSSRDTDERLQALDYMVKRRNVQFVVKVLNKLFKENKIEEHPFIDYAFANFSAKPKSSEDFDALFFALNSDNAYLRNATIKFLQEYGVESKQFISKLMEHKDKDIRIFAVNILGDVRYDDSIDMIRYFITKEKDVNALTTAIDYMGEIGSEEDIPLLQAVRDEFKNEPYLEFFINTAIKRIKDSK